MDEAVVPVQFRFVFRVDKFYQLLHLLTGIISGEHEGYERTEVTHRDMQFPLVNHRTQQPFQTVNHLITGTTVIEGIHIVLNEALVCQRAALAFAPKLRIGNGLNLLGEKAGRTPFSGGDRTEIEVDNHQAGQEIGVAFIVEIVFDALLEWFQTGFRFQEVNQAALIDGDDSAFR